MYKGLLWNKNSTEIEPEFQNRHQNEIEQNFTRRTVYNLIYVYIFLFYICNKNCKLEQHMNTSVLSANGLNYSGWCNQQITPINRRDGSI